MFRKNKRGQFLVTYAFNYGWLFLVLLVGLLAASVLFFKFGIISNSFCIGDTEFECRQISLEDDKMIVIVKNNKINTVLLYSTVFLHEKCGSKVSFEEPVRLVSQSEYPIVFECSNFPDKMSGELVINYQNHFSPMDWKSRMSLTAVK